MSDELQSPSLAEKGKNLAKFSWQLINYIQQNHEKVLVVNEDVYKERMMICRTCEKYNEIKNECAECGCYIPAKAQIVLDSCPLDKWKVKDDDWDEKFNNIIEDMDRQNPEKPN